MVPPPMPSGAHDRTSELTVEPGGTAWDTGPWTTAPLATSADGSVARPLSAAATCGPASAAGIVGDDCGWAAARDGCPPPTVTISVTAKPTTSADDPAMSQTRTRIEDPSRLPRHDHHQRPGRTYRRRGREGL